jgi:hypothetical protein
MSIAEKIGGRKNNYKILLKVAENRQKNMFEIIYCRINKIVSVFLDFLKEIHSYIELFCLKI